MRLEIRRWGVLGAFALLSPAGVLAQSSQTSSPAVVSGDGADSAPEWMKRLAIDPQSEVAKRYQAQAKKRADAERELRKIRAKHFGPIKATQIRQEGIVQLREYTDPALFPSMVRLFEREEADVRGALLDHFKDAACEEGDASLAWMAVFDRDAEVRAQATQRVAARIETLGATPLPVKFTAYRGLAARDQGSLRSAATFARGIDMIDAIPWLIAKQITGQPVGTPTTTGVSIGGGGQGDLAWIAIGQQTAFVSDLQPVVGPSAVGFDPQLSVVNEGVVLRVLDAAVVEYNVDIHNVLVDWTTDLTGQSTKQLGWNIPAWRDWYAKDFTPQMQAHRAKQTPK